MDLKTYEQIKFELAELIRAGQLIASEREQDPNKRYDTERPWRALLTRLAEDRFTVVVAGRFSRGKSSLMNAVLGMDRLPTGIVPLTSVITYVRYGTSERVCSITKVRDCEERPRSKNCLNTSRERKSGKCKAD